jgi:peptidoglycan-associated lipoprotein
MKITRTNVARVVGLTLLAVSVACAPRKPKVTNTPPPAPVAVAPEPPKPAPPPVPPPQPRPETVTRVAEPTPVPPVEDTVNTQSLEDLNRNSLLKPAFFPVDSFTLDDAGRAIVTADADILKKYPTWKIQVEGHADERGTAEYNLALGERRASAVKTYLLSLGIAEDRIRTISYGKEFPFEPGHDENAWSKNRRAHFVIVAK